jgi:GT2 family glycosyltransferase
VPCPTTEVVTTDPPSTFKCRVPGGLESAGVSRSPDLEEPPAIQPPLVSILIVNYNTRSLIRDCLESLRSVAYPAFEVLCVDNGSADGSARMIREDFPKVRLFESAENLGFVGANLLAYPQAEGDYVLFLNSDTTVEPNFLDILVDFMEEHPEAGGCEPKILWMKDPTRLDSIGDFLTWTGMLYHHGYLAPDAGLTSPEPIFSAKGACMMFRSSLLESIGVFDERYFAYFEETDLCWRTWLSGSKIFFVPDARVNHLLAGTSRNTDSHLVNFHSFKNRIHSMLKNLGTVEALKVLPVHLSLCVGIATMYALRGRFRKSSAILEALFWNIRNLRGTLASRRVVQREIRQVSDQELMRTAKVPVPLNYFWKLYREYESV